MDEAAPALMAQAQAQVRSRRTGAFRSVLLVVTGTLLGLTQGFGLYLVSANLGAIQGSLGATSAEASWLLSAYFGTALSATLLLTKARMQVGLRWFAAVGLVAYVAVAMLHLATDTVATAVVARAALGLAAAPLSTLAVLYCLEALPPRMAPLALLQAFAAMQLPGPFARVIAPDLLELGRWHGLFLLDVGLALVCLGGIAALPLKSQPRQPAFNRGDLPAFVLYATGLGLLSVVLTQGRIAWWTDAPWLGVCLAGAVCCMGIYATLDLVRACPLLNLRWLARAYMLRLVAAIVVFRVVLSEQTVAVPGFMAALGQSNEQMRLLFGVATAAMLLGFAMAAALAALQGVRWLPVIAAALVCVAAWIDGGATSTTRPEQMVVSQALLAAGLACFFAAALLLGFGPVLQDDGRELVTFLAAFSGAQYLGSLLGTAWINTYVAQRQQWHYAALAQHLELGDPQVAQRITLLGRSLGPWLTDAGARAHEGLALLARQVQRESFVLAYIDVFQAIAALSLVLAAWLAALGWRAWRRASQGRPAASATPGSP